MKQSLILIAVALCTGMAAHADLMPDFSAIPAGWSTDRYDPHSFSNVGIFQGRNDVLGIEINSAEGFTSRPGGYQSTFYNTQGRQHSISGGAGTSIAADLYIPSTWSGTAGNERTDMWGRILDPTAGSDPHQYPIIGFTNFGGAPRYRVWDEDTANGWVDLATPVSFDAWTAFAIAYTGSSYEFYINGGLVYTDLTVVGATGFDGVIMQAYNFYGDPNPDLAGAVGVDYTAHWSNAVAPVPEPSAWMLLGTAALAIGGVMRKRKSKV